MKTRVHGPARFLAQLRVHVVHGAGSGCAQQQAGKCGQDESLHREVSPCLGFFGTVTVNSMGVSTGGSTATFPLTEP